MSERRGLAGRWIPWTLFGALALLYWHGRCLTFGPGDSPQHVLSAVTWGVSWPPGYPLYVLLGRLASLLPGPAAGNVNALSGLLHAAAAVFLYLTLRRGGLRPFACALAGALMGLSPLFWYYSEVAEVRALNDLLALASAYCAVVWIEERTPAAGLRLAACLGFGLGHHPTFVLICPALLCLIACGRAWPTARQAALSAAAAAGCCALPYMILWLRIRWSPPAYNLIAVHDLRGVLDLFLRTQLGGPLRAVGGRGFLSLQSFDGAALLRHLSWFARSGLTELHPLAVLLLGPGLWALWRRDRRALLCWGLWLLSAAFCYILIASQQLHLKDLDYARAVAARFYLLPFIAVCAAAGYGAQTLAEVLPAAPLRVLLAAALVLPALLRPIDLRGHDPTMDYARELLRGSGPSDMILLDMDESSFALAYLDLVGHETQDRVLLVPSLFSFPPYFDSLSRRHPTLRLPPRELSLDWRVWQRLNPGRGLCAEPELKDSVLAQFPRAAPAGLLIRLADTPPAPEELARGARELLDSPALARLLSGGVIRFTQEEFLPKAYRSMLSWYAALLGPSEPRLAGAVAELSKI